jgi:hypothetical protein
MFDSVQTRLGDNARAPLIVAQTVALDRPDRPGDAGSRAVVSCAHRSEHI